MNGTIIPYATTENGGCANRILGYNPHMDLYPPLFQDSRAAFVLDALERMKDAGPNRILDVGFIGDYTEPHLHYAVRDALKPGDTIVGIDNDPSFIEKFHSLPKSKDVPAGVTADYRQVSLYESGLPKASFDAILLCEVLEHLPEPFGAITELTTLLKPGGRLILTYPNPLSVPLFIRYLFQKKIFDDAFLDTFRGFHEHRVFPHPASLAVTLRAMGYTTGHATFIKIMGGAPMRFLARHSAAVRKFGSYAGICAVKA